MLRLAARRFLRDLNRALGKRPPFYFSANWANKVCRFIEGLPHIEGQWATATLTLEPCQIFFVVQLFGFRNIDGGRRFTSALYSIARKNAKSTLAAAIMLACLCLERENGPQVISAATTGDQARIVWNIAKGMVDRTPALRDEFDLESFSKSIVRAEVGGLFKAINAKASTQDGLNPSHTNLDEIHAHKTADLLNVLTSAAGARSNPLWLYTTTEGYENPGPWAEIRNFAKHILEQVLRADHFLAVVYAVDDDDDTFDERCWIKANPLMAANPQLLKQMQSQAIEAKAMPSRLAEFEIKRLNRRAATSKGWIRLPKWRACGGSFDLDKLVGLPCWAAFDLASTTDMSAWALIWNDPEAGKWYSHVRYWVPEEAVKQRTERRTVNYAGWVAAGHITQTAGDVTDYGAIERVILDDYARFEPRKIGFDPWNAAGLANNLVNNGLPLEQFIQGPKSYNPAMKSLEMVYIAGHLVHGGNPVLTWNAANLVERHDANLNLAPDRKRSADKIDGMTALIMAFGLALADDTAAFDRYLSNPVSA